MKAVFDVGGGEGRVKKKKGGDKWETDGGQVKQFRDPAGTVGFAERMV